MYSQTDAAATVLFILGLVVLVLFILCTPSQHPER